MRSAELTLTRVKNPHLKELARYSHRTPRKDRSIAASVRLENADTAGRGEAFECIMSVLEHIDNNDILREMVKGELGNYVGEIKRKTLLKLDSGETEHTVPNQALFSSKIPEILHSLLLHNVYMMCRPEYG